jgi:hypothetical protein
MAEQMSRQSWRALPPFPAGMKTAAENRKSGGSGWRKQEKVEKFGEIVMLHGFPWKIVASALPMENIVL